jgi:GrpB-like predicted nucleotidyltransferase (UPF0157 family)
MVEIVLSPHDAAWTTAFATLGREIRDALGNRALTIEHVGSTSIPKLSAKPVIDIVLAVSDSADEAAYVPSLEACGYTLQIREPDWFEHRLLKASCAAVNLHVFSFGCEEIDRMLQFRDWLRTHDEDRELYEYTKRSLAARHWKDIDQYATAKSEVVEAIMRRAHAASHS